MISKYYYKVTPLRSCSGVLFVDFDFHLNSEIATGGYPCVETFDDIDDAVVNGIRAVKKFFNNSNLVDHADALRLEIIDAKDNLEVQNFVIFRGTGICSYCGSIGKFSFNQGRLTCLSCNRTRGVDDIRTRIGD